MKPPVSWLTNLQGHLCIFIENGNIKHQSSEQVLQHGGPEVPADITNVNLETFVFFVFHLTKIKPEDDGTDLQSDMRHSSMTSLCALVRARPRDRR